MFGLYETIQLDLDLANCVIHPRGDARFTTPKPGAKKTVFPSRSSADAFDINLETPLFLFSGALRGWRFSIQIPKLVNIADIVPIAAVRVAHVGLAAGIQILWFNRMLGTTKNTRRSIASVVAGAIEEHCDTHRDGRFRFGPG